MRIFFCWGEMVVYIIVLMHPFKQQIYQIYSNIWLVVEPTYLKQYAQVKLG